MQVTKQQHNMTKQQLEKALVYLDWTNAIAARELGVNERRIYYFLKGERDIPLYVKNALALHIRLKQITDALSCSDFNIS